VHEGPLLRNGNSASSRALLTDRDFNFTVALVFSIQVDDTSTGSQEKLARIGSFGEYGILLSRFCIRYSLSFFLTIATVRNRPLWDRGPAYANLNYSRLYMNHPVDLPYHITRHGSGLTLLSRLIDGSSYGYSHGRIVTVVGPSRSVR